MEEYVLKFEELGLVPGSFIYDRERNLWKVTGIEFCLNRKKIIPFLRCVIAEQNTTGPLTLQKRRFAVGKDSIGKTIFLPNENMEEADDKTE